MPSRERGTVPNGVWTEEPTGRTAGRPHRSHRSRDGERSVPKGSDRRGTERRFREKRGRKKRMRRFIRYLGWPFKGRHRQAVNA